MVLDYRSQAESVQNVIYALWIRIRLDVREALFQHAPAVLDSTSAHKWVLFMHIKVRVIDPEVVPAILT